MSKKYLFVALLAFVIVALAAAPAFAEGYNEPTQYTSAGGWFSGPHGGYTTSTNKCADCHATHYAAGSFMLMRANSREAACDYCHGGGGGSSINIMMDNEYKAYSDEFWLDGSAVATTTSGFGTGHTLGYTGKAPADIKPAYEDTEGLACFDCHSPHGNSARIIGVIGDPGRALGWDDQVIPNTLPPYIGNSADGTLNSAGEWGIDPVFGNFKWFGDPYTAANRPADDTAGGRVIYRPIFPAGRFLLVKDPHSTAVEGEADTVTPFTLSLSTTATVATDGVNKYEIDWDEPMGPADGGYGGFQDNDLDKAFPFAPQIADVDGDGLPDGGFASVSEFCVDCHDGTAGASTQPAEVWQPSGTSGSTVGAYAVTFSHDAQPRH